MSNRTSLIIQIASETEVERKNHDWSAEVTIQQFIKNLQENKVSSYSWFSVDEEIRKNHESKKWFWLIRTVRNQQLKW